MSIAATNGTHVGPLELQRADGLLYALGPHHPPVLAVDPGERVRIETELNIGDVLHDVDDRFSAEMVVRERVNPATGPIEIRGAEPGQVVVCDIEEMELHGPGFTALMPGFSPFPDWVREREFGVHARVVGIAGGYVDWPGGPRLPVQPMVGVIGCAPANESVSTADNGPHGGNLDVQEMGPGCRVLLPVGVDGALFALGDCHARQGDGELCGIGAIECRTHTTVRLGLAPRPPEMRWPRIVTETHLGVVACARPLEDAFRLAAADLVAWMSADYGMSAAEAVLLLGQVAEARATQIVNPKYTYIVKVAKKWLTAAPGRERSP